MSINKVVISGNLTRDPEIRATQSGMNILTFGMAVNDRRRNPQTGEWEDYANFIDCVLFGNRADYLSRNLRKGIKVVVEGKLRYSSWERDGQRRNKIEVVVDDVDFVSPRNQSYDGGQQYGGQSYGQSQGQYNQPQGQGQGQYGQPQGQGQYQPRNQYANQGSAQSQPRDQYGQQPVYNAPAPQQGAQDSRPAYNAPAPQQSQAPAQQSAPSQVPAPAPQGQQPASGAQSASQPGAQAPASPHPVVSTPPQTEVYDEDIPF